VGPLRDVAGRWHWAFAQDGFEPMPEPQPGDWLYEHAESPQSFAQFTVEQPHRPGPNRANLVVSPLDPDGLARPSTPEILAYLHAYFTLPVTTLEAKLDRATLEPRTHDGRLQLRTEPILDALELLVPADAYALLAVTSEDLYPDPAWNFVFGMARLQHRVGVFSLARYGSGVGTLALRRGLTVLSHEVGHMFGISHCVHYACLMNGFNSLQELDRTPMQLCRVCLRKLHSLTAFDPAARYTAVRAQLVALGLDDAVPWIDARLASAGR
jgi:archaemetzincin